MEAPKLHTFVWNELLSTDVEADKKFYETVFGWTSETQDMGHVMYTTFKQQDGQYAGGMMKNPNPMAKESIWVAYVSVENVQKSLDKAAAAGANIIVPKIFIETVGDLGMGITKSGAVIGFFKPLMQNKA